MKVISLFILFGLMACSNNNDEQIKKELAIKLKDCNKVIIQAFQNRDTFNTFTQDKSTIITFKELMNGRQDKKLGCTPKGQLIFMQNDSILLAATTSSNCTQYHLNGQTYQTRMTLRAGLLIEEVTERLIKERKK
ncbi:MAG: hypothetical protein V4538_09805 [Bacteroidota bacterium]